MVKGFGIFRVAEYQFLDLVFCQSDMLNGFRVAEYQFLENVYYAETV